MIIICPSKSNFSPPYPFTVLRNVFIFNSSLWKKLYQDQEIKRELFPDFVIIFFSRQWKWNEGFRSCVYQLCNFMSYSIVHAFANFKNNPPSQTCWIEGLVELKNWQIFYILFLKCTIWYNTKNERCFHSCWRFLSEHVLRTIFRICKKFYNLKIL